MVDKQMEMLQTAMTRNLRDLLCPRWTARRLSRWLQKAQAARSPVIGFDSGVTATFR